MDLHFTVYNTKSLPFQSLIFKSSDRDPSAVAEQAGLARTLLVTSELLPRVDPGAPVSKLQTRRSPGRQCFFPRINNPSILLRRRFGPNVELTDRRVQRPIRTGRVTTRSCMRNIRANPSDSIPPKSRDGEGMFTAGMEIPHRAQKGPNHLISGETCVWQVSREFLF